MGVCEGGLASARKCAWTPSSGCFFTKLKILKLGSIPDGATLDGACWLSRWLALPLCEMCQIRLARRLAVILIVGHLETVGTWETATEEKSSECENAKDEENLRHTVILQAGGSIFGESRGRGTDTQCTVNITGDRGGESLV